VDDYILELEEAILSLRDFADSDGVHICPFCKGEPSYLDSGYNIIHGQSCPVIVVLAARHRRITNYSEESLL
jgi:hypothetical protein